MTPISPAELAFQWPSICKTLQKLSAKSAWTPEHVYTEVMAGRARLFTGNNSVLVTVAQEEEFTKAKVLHVWIGISELDDYERGLEWVKQHARDFGFTKITFESERKGWEKRFPIESIRYRIEI